jgi:hypothetical protein
MKIKLIIIAIVLITVLLPLTASANGNVTLSTSSDIFYANQDDEVMIYLTVHNDTNSYITIDQYSINNVWYSMSLSDVAPGNQLEIPYMINSIDFLENDHAVIMGLAVGYDNGNQFVYGNDVIIHRDQTALADPPSEISVSFEVSADETDIEAGSWVNITVTCKNLGAIDLRNFTVLANAPTLKVFDLSVGETKVVYYSNQYFDPTTESFGYSYLYTDNNGNNYGDAFSDVNKVNINVRPASTQAPVPTDTPTQSPSTKATQSPSSKPSPSSSQDGSVQAESPQTSKEAEGQVSESSAETSKSADGKIASEDDPNDEALARSDKKERNLNLIIIYIAAGLVFITLVIICY